MKPAEKTSAPRRPTPVPAVAGLDAYSPPRHLAPVDLLLAGNEGDWPSTDLLHWVAERDVSVLRRYPSARELEAALAERLAVAPEQVAVTAGGDEAIDRVCRAYLAAGRRIAMPQPTFVMLPYYAALAGAVVDAVPWREGPYPLNAVLEAITEETAVVVVVSPNNPNGAVATAADLRALAEAAPHAVLLVDLAYAEYADEDLTAAALAFSNAVVVRTISKAWGLAGLRVGYAVGSPEMIAVLRAAGGPYSVSGLSLALAGRALATGTEAKERHVARVRVERRQLEALVAELGLSAPTSQGNFVLVRTADPTWLRDGLAGLGIAVRIFPGEAGLEDCARITCPGDEASFDRLCRALRAVVQPQALLFDLDGVLADVSRSYRRAIEATAASYGVTVTADDVARIKAAGDANNDWVVTHRLIVAGGVPAELAEVTERFEELYQGTDAEPGLRRHETLLPPRELLQQWAARLPLGIVTGRPRRDAERWLADQGLAELFGTVVCMEDGPVKPDPAPVTIALNRMSVASAWMFGDTPDDVRAARGAGVVPIGLPAPGEDRVRAADTLLRAGAARVVTDLSEIEECLP